MSPAYRCRVKEAAAPTMLPKPLTARRTKPGTRYVENGVSLSNSIGMPRLAPLGSKISAKIQNMLDGALNREQKAEEAPESAEAPSTEEV